MSINTQPHPPMLFPVDRTRYAVFALSRRVHQAMHTFPHWVGLRQAQVAGAYFTGNLGDLTMARLLVATGRRRGVRAGIRAYGGRGLRRPVIMGGGELGDSDRFESAIKMAGYPDRVAVCGVNPIASFASFSSDLLGRIARIPYISIRSESGADLMRRVLKRDDIEYNPDIAFALYQSPRPEESLDRIGPNGRRKRRLGLNALHFYMSVQHRRAFAPDLSLKPILQNTDPVFANEYLGTAGPRFVRLLKHLADVHLAQGWEVVNIPFTAVDELFASATLAGSSVELLPYRSDPLAVIKTLQGCDKFVATRFHAHIFGLLARVPTVSIGYSGKCVSLWNELGLEPGSQVTRVDVCSDTDRCARALSDSSGVVLADGLLEGLARRAQGSMEKAYSALFPS